MACAAQWPGNLPELNNVLDYGARGARGGGGRGGAAAPPRGGPPPPPHAATPTLPPQAQRLLQDLRAARWNISAVAHQLGVARMTVYRRTQRWGIREPGRD